MLCRIIIKDRLDIEIDLYTSFDSVGHIFQVLANFIPCALFVPAADAIQDLFVKTQSTADSSG